MPEQDGPAASEPERDLPADSNNSAAVTEEKNPASKGSYVGLGLSLIGFFGVLLPFFSHNPKLVNLKVFGGSIVCLIVGNVVSRIFYNKKTDDASRTLLRGAFAITFVFGVLIAIVLGFVVFYIWSTAQKS